MQHVRAPHPRVPSELGSRDNDLGSLLVAIACVLAIGILYVAFLMVEPGSPVGI